MSTNNDIDWMNLEILLDSRRVRHDSYDYAFGRAKQLVRPGAPDRSPVGLAIVGDARVGKSTILTAVREAFPSKRLDDGVRMPVVSVKVPQKPTVMALAEVLLQALGDTKAHLGSKNNKTMRVKRQLRGVGAWVVTLDDFQHFEDKATSKIQYEASDWLKEIMDDAAVNLLVAGLPSCLRIMRMNEQLRGRFMRPVRLRRFDWRSDDERQQLMEVLEQWQKMLSMFQMPALGEEMMAFRFYCASGGLTGYVFKILRQAVWNAIDAKTLKITLEDLEFAHLDAVDDDDCGDVSPFATAFDMTDTKEQVAKARRIGAHVEPPQNDHPEGSKPRRGKPASASEAHNLK